MHTEPTRSGSLVILLAISWDKQDSDTTTADPSAQNPRITQEFGEGKTSRDLQTPRSPQD